MKIKIVIACMITALLLCACAPAEGPGTTEGGMQQSTVKVTDGNTPESKTDEEKLAEFYQDGFNTNALIGMDQFGRVFEAGGKDREGKETGIFYWPWFKAGADDNVYDNSKILAMENGLSILTSPDLPNTAVSPAGEDHWWGEPLFGYYSSKDKWVIRRHLRMLELAGIDYICFDSTNMLPFVSEAKAVLDCIVEMQNDGFNPPRLTFYTNARSIETVRKLYNGIYKNGYGKSGWYTYNGKPFIIGYTTAKEDMNEAKKGRGDTSYNPGEHTKEILDFFIFARPEWPSEYKTFENSIAWVEWRYPAPVHKLFNCMTVSPAAHPGCPFSFSLTGKSTNWGRGWDPDTKRNISENAEKGTYFQAAWDVALAADPDMVFIGGWNEWCMRKSLYGGEYVFVDNVNLEYSRDIEPMKGGYNDAFYMQMVANIRRYKKTGVTDASFPAVTPGADFDWKSVKAVFRKIEAVNQSRDAEGKAKTQHYTEAAARNNIKEIRVVTDENNLYFHITCAEDITQRQDADWMNLFIGCGSLAQKGWEGYEYVINRSGLGAIDKLSADFSLTPGGSAQTEVRGETMLVTIPRAALNLTKDNNSFYFKVADNVTAQADIMDYYVSGCSVPMGRMSFRYVG